jgi:hypothetical protein
MVSDEWEAFSKTRALLLSLNVQFLAISASVEPGE